MITRTQRDTDERVAPDGRANPLVSIIIPHFNDLDNLQNCLDLLLRQSFDHDRFEIVVADNRSGVGLDAVREAVGGRGRVISAETPGAGPARNSGVAASSGSILAFIDSDCRPDPSWLAEGVAALETYDVVGGAIRVSVGDPDHMTAIEAFEVVFAFRNDAYVRSKHFTVTASMFTRRATFDAVGDFRTEVSEDIEWCERAQAKGFSLGYADRSVVLHPARRDWIELKNKWRRLTRETYLLSREKRVSRARWLGRAWLVLISIVPHAWLIIASRSLPTARDRLRATAVLIRIRTFRWLEAHRLVFSGM
jgi:glycosyltransferase involved in cell wall biosynthesis